MILKKRFSAWWVLPVMVGMCLLALFACARPAQALNPIPTPDPKPGSFGLEATKKKAPPKVGATITTPGNGASFTTSPITVSGICPEGLLVQVYNNNVMVGSVMCKGGSFSVEVGLFAGENELMAMVYDELGQAGPKSNIVTVRYNVTNFTEFAKQITLTSAYGRRSAPAGNELGWPLQLSGGTGPYAFSIDWGDGKPPELKSQPNAGLLTVAHVYKKAGIYPVSVKVTDVKGVTAFLQVVALANGKVDEEQKDEKAEPTVLPPKILWAPTAVAMVLLVPAYWLGRRSQVVSLHKKMLKERDKYKQK